MFSKILIASLLVLLVACEPAPKDEREYERTNIKLNVLLFDSEREMNNHIRSNFNVSKLDREGFAVWYKDDPTNECTIFVLRGVESKLESVYGHELMHCIYGSFHKEI